jgi:1-acyl-sn-glycerol-3-phosphate acyltransferase
MADETLEQRKNDTLAQSANAGLLPTAEEIGVLRPIERTGFKLVRAMNFGAWKRFWTFCQRHIGSFWIYVATYNLMNVFGIENVENSDASRPLILVANHRSFFDMYTVSSVMFRRTTRPIKLFFSRAGKVLLRQSRRLVR